jgi:DNA-binding CsgD family transcriptional regulator
VEDQRLQQVSSLAQWLLEQDGRAVFLLDASANVVQSNSAAQRLCQDDGWAQILYGKLNFSMPSVQSWLLTSMTSSDRRASMPVGTAENRTLLRLQHVAHDVIEGAESQPPSDLFVLTIGDSAPSTVLRDDLRAAYGLTVAESAVAAELYTGKSLARVAEVLGLSVNTVKTHVKRVFRKCNVRSHVQLVKRIDGIA